MTTDVAALACRHAVVLGEPIAVIAPPRSAGQVEAVPERLGGGAAFDDRARSRMERSVMSNSVRRPPKLCPTHGGQVLHFNITNC